MISSGLKKEKGRTITICRATGSLMKIVGQKPLIHLVGVTMEQYMERSLHMAELAGLCSLTGLMIT